MTVKSASIADVFKEVTRLIRNEFGNGALIRIKAGLHLEDHIASYVKRNNPEGISTQEDVEDIAGAFFDSMHFQFELIADPYRRVAGATTKQTSETYASPNRGSLQNIAGYANAISYVVQARQDIFGSKEPMSHEAAVAWLRKEAQNGEPVVWVEIKRRFKVPKAVGDEIVGQDGRIVDPSLAEVVGRLKNAEIEPLGQEPRLKQWVRRDAKTFFIRPFDTEETIILEAGKLVALAEYADWLSDICAGFERAVWLILTGKWERRAMSGSTPLHGSKGDTAHTNYRVTFEIGELETTPDELKQFYAETRRQLGYGTKGQALSRKAEILACLALEVKAVRNITMGEPGFYSHVLTLWRQRASEYGYSQSEPKSENAVRKVLNRVEEAHKHLTSSPRGKMLSYHDPGTLFRRASPTTFELFMQFQENPSEGNYSRWRAKHDSLE